jgi:ADP-heptose:LPS heptosyltransferase
MVERKERVLLVPFSGLGDLMMHLSLIAALKDQFDVDVVIDQAYESFGAFLKAHHIISDSVACDQSKTVKGFLTKIVFFLARVDHKSYRYILVYDRPLFTLLSHFLPSQKVVRYGLFRKRLRGPMGWSPHPKRTNQTDAVMDFARYLQHPAVERSYTFPQAVLDRCRNRARELLERFEGDRKVAPLVVIAPFAKHPYKQAPLHLFQTVARRAMSAGLRVAMIGASSDRGLTEPFHAQLDLGPGDAFLDVVGLLDWEETLGLLGWSTVLVTNDSGIMHVGLASGTSTVAFFGPTDPYALVPPVTQHLHPVFLGLHCQPCWQEGPLRRFRCPEGKKACLERIDAERIVELVSHIVALRGPEKPAIIPTVERS